ncbi:signal transduction histidine kinase [Duganella sp. 3397]|uniref:CHASE domain-containing protein n=1 Tax=Duganella sp. 3397 TaxID=2817732 RepID=UPI002866DE92|nr:CHASE domain-containing protein [Duganella sp. 3397]MDR7050767.1 signal transduction histidine kinase [Duganella sp. 3397]
MAGFLAQRQWFSPSKPVWWAGILLSLAVGALCYVAADHAVEYDGKARFMHQARNAQYHISAHIDSYTNVLRATASFFDASDNITPADFHRFVSGLQLPQHYPALDGINYCPYLTDAGRDTFEQAARHSGDGRADGYPAFEIRPRDRRPDYSVITMIEPIARFRDRVGLNIAARPAVAESLARARDTGEVSTSGQLIEMNSLGQGGGGMALRLALYRHGAPRETVEQRRANFIGSVGIGFSVPRLVQLAMEQMQVRDVRLRLYDGGSASAPMARNTLLFDSQPLGKNERPSQLYSVVLPLDFHGRQWHTLFSAPKRAWSSRFDLFLPWLAMATGFIGTLMFYLLFHTLSSSRLRAIAMAKEMTSELRDSQARLQQSHHKLRRLAAHADQIKEQERKRIAREIHDDLGQNLLVLRIEADLLATRTRHRHPRLHARAVATLHQIDSTIKSVRHIINDLRPTVLDLGLNPAVEWQIAQFRTRSGMVCEFIEHQQDIRVDDRCATAIFRILQESLSNIAQHARASLVRVELAEVDDMLTMTITDNGVGLRANSRNKVGSFGLVGIEERITLLGGTCAIQGGPNGGTMVSISVPLGHGAPVMDPAMEKSHAARNFLTNIDENQ